MSINILAAKRFAQFIASDAGRTYLSTHGLPGDGVIVADEHERIDEVLTRAERYKSPTTIAVHFEDDRFSIGILTVATEDHPDDIPVDPSSPIGMIVLAAGKGRLKFQLTEWRAPVSLTDFALA